MSAPPPEGVSFWNACLRRRLDWREVDGGRVVVLHPQFGEGRLGRWLAARWGNPCYRIRLDEVGAFVWKACDGETPLIVIAGRLRDRFGAAVEPVEERVGRFAQTMLRARMVTR